jgi:hypothetical protein
LDWLSTLDERGVAVRQTGGRDPHRGIQIPGVPAGGSQPTDAGSRAPPPPRPSAPRTRARGLRAVLPPRVVPGDRRERGGTDCIAPTGLSSRIYPLIRTSPRSARGQLAGSRRPAPRPRARRGASVLHQYHHQSCRHHHLAHHRRRGSSIISRNNSRGSGRLASRVAGRSKAPSKCTPFHFPHWSSSHVDGY